MSLRKLAPILVLMLIIAFFIPATLGENVDDYQYDIDLEGTAEESSRRDELREREESNVRDHPYEGVERYGLDVAVDEIDVDDITDMSVSNNLVSKSEAREIEVEVDLGYEPDDVDALEWTFGGLSLDEWQKFDTDEGDYTGDPFIFIETDVDRLYGPDRYTTSADVALEAYEKADNVIIARGDDAGGWADGLAASFLSGVLDAPILLTRPGELPDSVNTAIDTLEADNAYVLGGTAAVSDDVVAELEGKDLTVERIAGESRHETASLIAGFEEETYETAFVVQGRAPADSMVAGPIARVHGFPVLLVSEDSIPECTEEAITDLEIEELIVVGGEGVISASVYDQLETMVDEIERWAGADRFETSVEAALECHETDAFTIVGGHNLADAVGAATLERPILYSETDAVPPVVQDYLDDVLHGNSQLCLLGGPAAISEAVEAGLRNAPYYCEEDELVKATVNFGLVYDRTNLSGRDVRVRILDLIGNYYLQVEDPAEDKRASEMMTLNVYDSFRTYDQIKPEVMDIFDRAKHDRYLEYQSLGYSVEGREIPFVIITQSEDDVDEYLDDFLPDALEDPASLQEKIDDGTIGDYKIPMWINNVHPDETPGVDAQIDLIEKFATQDYITFKMTDDDYGEGEEYEVVLEVDEVLDNIILLFNITNNPDGRYHITRGNVHGFDLNRDYGFQTQVETQAVVENIAKWTPISVLDLHGFVTGFLIEPCTPPHEFNLEYDLYLDNAMGQAHAMGNAGTANTEGFGLDSYFIPRETWDDGWDDGTLSYTPMYAMQHGAMGHTIEMPQLNEMNNTAMIYTVLGAINYVLEDKDDLYYDQLEWFRRGVEGIDAADEVDDLFVDPDGNPIGRPRDPHDNFFPDYYVIPVEEELQKNTLEAYRMAETLLRNGIRVHKSTDEVTVGDDTYPEGSLVVDMRQAKRGLANAFLYDGPDFTEWANMYAEVVAAYHHLRGFDRYEVREEGAFEDSLDEYTEAEMPETVVDGDDDHYILKNVNNDTIKAVNTLLGAGETVEMVMEAGADWVKGDFLVTEAGLDMVEDDFSLEALAVADPDDVDAESIEKPEVAGYGWQAEFVLFEYLGFEEADLEDANVIVDDAGEADDEDIKARVEDGVPYIGVGGFAAASLEDSELLPGLERETTRFTHEGTLRTEVDTDSVMTGRYMEEEVLYTRHGTYLTDVPATSAVLANLVDDEDFYVAGWWPGYEEAQGSDFIITDDDGDARITLFTGNLTNRAHPRHQFRMLANAIYLSVSE